MERSGGVPGPGTTRDWTAIAALVVLALLPVLPALDRLGLTSDDYFIFAGFEQVRDAPWPRILDFTLETYATRPAQGLASGLLYYAFGLEPLPYVLVVLGLVAGSVVLFWWLLIRLRVEPALAFGAASIFAVLPQLSTVRVWFSTLCVAADLFLFLAGAHCLISWLRGRRLSSAFAVSLLWALSLAFYELFVPFMVGMLVFAWWRLTHGDVRGRGLAAARPLLPHLLVIVSALAAKAAFTDRADGWDARFIFQQALRPGYDRETDFGFNFKAFIETHVFDTFAFPLRSLTFFAEWQLLPHVFASLVAATLIFLVTIRSHRPSDHSSPRKVAALGILISVLGYGIFLLNPSTSFTIAGIGNRTAVASALGLAMAIAGSIMALTANAPARTRHLLGAAILALLGLLFTLASARISEHWARAYQTQKTVLQQVRQDLSWLKPGSIVLLDGLCPYAGPGIIFETDWDVAGALSLVLKRPISGNLMAGGMSFGPGGAVATIYAERYFYPYSVNTFAYDVRTRTVTRLADREAASRYLQRRRPQTCPRGYAGHGVPI